MPYSTDTTYDTPATSTATISTLPDGSVDTYNISKIANESIFTGVGQNANLHDATSGDSGGPTSTGPQYDLAYKLAQNVASMSRTNPNAYAEIQAEMYDATFYGATKPTLGNWNSTRDGDALSTALTSYIGAHANGSAPEDFFTWLGNQAGNGRAQGGPGGGGGGSAKAPLQLTSSATLDQYSDQAGQSELGRNTTSAEQSAFASNYHGQETAAYNGGPQAAGAPDAEAKQFVDTNNQGEVQTHLQADYAERMLSMLGVQSS